MASFINQILDYDITKSQSKIKRFNCPCDLEHTQLKEYIFTNF